MCTHCHKAPGCCLGWVSRAEQPGCCRVKGFRGDLGVPVVLRVVQGGLPGEHEQHVDEHDRCGRIAVAAAGIGDGQIAQAADVAVGTVYRRFPDKESLVWALFAGQVDAAASSAHRALEVEDPWQALTGFLADVLGALAESRGLRELSAGSSHGRALAAYAREQIAPAVTELVRRGHAAEVLREEVTEQDLAMIPVMVGAVIRATAEVRPEQWRRMLAIVLDGLRPGHPRPLPGHALNDPQVEQIIGGQ